MNSVAELLLPWFDKNQRDLPWREGERRNPYAVWISEIMLQQTRTEAVKPYFAHWMEKFPTIEKLAEAEESSVLHAWQGLGYYSRARNIHLAAKEVAERYGGTFPKEEENIRNLPGIGEYTTGAIMSLAFGEQKAAIDGNVLRVFSRLFLVEEEIDKGKGKKVISSLVEEELPQRAGAFNEALMDLGSSICTPKNPKCKSCPLASICKAFHEGKQEELPRKSAKKKQKEFDVAVAIWEKEGKFLLRKRPEKGMLASMWEFPSIILPKGEETVVQCRKELEDFLSGNAERKIWDYTHVFTHQIWHMKAYAMEGSCVPEGEYAWFSPEEYKEIPLAGPHAKLAAAIEP